MALNSSQSSYWLRSDLWEIFIYIYIYFFFWLSNQVSILHQWKAVQKDLKLDRMWIPRGLRVFFSVVAPGTRGTIHLCCVNEWTQLDGAKLLVLILLKVSLPGLIWIPSGLWSTYWKQHIVPFLPLWSQVTKHWSQERSKDWEEYFLFCLVVYNLQTGAGLPPLLQMVFNDVLHRKS